MNFDKILVLNNGMIAEQGSHDELMHQEALYDDICQLQQYAEV